MLNADDELVAAMATHSKGEVLFYTRNPESEILTQHLKNDGRAVIVRDDILWLTTGPNEEKLCALVEVAMPTSGHFDFHVEDVLAAVGAAWAYGLESSLIIERLQNFS